MTAEELERQAAAVRLSEAGWLALRNTATGRAYRSARGLSACRRAGLLDEAGELTELGRAVYRRAYRT